MKYWRLALAAISFFLALALWAWGTTKNESVPKQADKPVIAASFYPLSFLASRLGDGTFDVVSITPSGVEPHDFEPSPQDALRLQNADVFIYMGGGFDPWAEKLATQLEKEGTKTLNVIAALAAKAPERLLSSRDVPDDHDEEESDEADHIYDTHVWLDPMLYAEATRLVADLLKSAAPAQSSAIQAKAGEFIARLERLDQEYAQALSSCRQQEIIVSHNAFRYLGQRYGFSIIPIAGFSPQEQPSARHLSELVTLAKAKGITTIFFETLASPKLSETLANEVGAKTAVLDPIEGISQADQDLGIDYFALMEANVKALRSARQCQ